MFLLFYFKENQSNLEVGGEVRLPQNTFGCRYFVGLPSLRRKARRKAAGRSVVEKPGSVL